MTTAPDRPSLFERWGTRGTLAIASLGAVVLLLGGFLIGWLGRGSDAPTGANAAVSAVPGVDSVEAGFTRDMIVHHRQAVLLANIAARNTQDPEIAAMTFDLAAIQQTQIGQMQGWLQLWQLPEQVPGPRMTWMGHADHAMSSGHDMSPASSHTGHSAEPTADDSGHAAVMPGMATSGEIERLKTLRGKDSDSYYLQLMLRHHRGGEAMMEYAAGHAKNPVVVTFAGKMLQAQTDESKVMTQMLAKRGLQPLPFPG